MTHDEMNQVIYEAERTMNYADRMASTIARLLVGRLRKVKDARVLRHFKKELRGFNMTTGEWNND